MSLPAATRLNVSDSGALALSGVSGLNARTVMGHFHRGPFLVAFPLGLVTATFSPLFWPDKIMVLSRPTTRLSRAEYAQEREERWLGGYNYNKMDICDRDLIVTHVSK